jgi:hypothetical protein
MKNQHVIQVAPRVWRVQWFHKAAGGGREAMCSRRNSPLRTDWAKSLSRGQVVVGPPAHRHIGEVASRRRPFAHQQNESGGLRQLLGELPARKFAGAKNTLDAASRRSIAVSILSASAASGER